MLRNKLSYIILLCISLNLSAQDFEVYPTHWWAGMQNRQLQLMVHSNTDISSIATVSYPGVRLIRIAQPENKHYVFIDLEITAATKPGSFDIRFSDGKKLRYQLKLKSSVNGSQRVQGVHSDDFIYLIMPDRFSNGDPSNDVQVDYRDTVAERSNPRARHGGDIKGVQNHLDYLKDLGVNTIWMTPVMENDMPMMQEGQNLMSGYHGYWITNHYKVDKRHGGNQAYHDLVNAAHKKGMKIIQDAVYNHVGEYHHTVIDPPMKDWLNQWPSYQGSNHREEVFMDPYASAIDKKIMIGGWFVPHLPDLNLANPYVAKFIIQSSIWATEEFGIDGWRVDTYKYCDEQFLNNINIALKKEFPAITVFGEAWTNLVPEAAYFVQNNMNTKFKHNAQGVTDFPVTGAIYDAVKQKAQWTEGAGKLYETLSQDFLYKNPLRNCIFLDNHDMDRFYSVAGEDIARYKMGVGLLLTLRGIPQLYYGTEILMKNFKNPSDAEVRKDFPGGFAGDSEDKFTSAGRAALENEAFDYTKKLATYRRNSLALRRGKTMQYIPLNGVYVYFRYNDTQTVMCILNSNDAATNLNLDRFSERIGNRTSAKNIMTGNSDALNTELKLPANSFTVLELK
ncbi:alpha-amylase family glycosyl hydrolase [Pollutibacter soli]|uniref:alpha-amylase family glycosyl hydrolase n=1 Tax=Pollutibacter soli TaxID=3034157 RepID=UPI0030132D1D